MTTSNEWDPVPAAPQHETTQYETTQHEATQHETPQHETPQYETTPIADELSATTSGATHDEASAKDRAQDAAATAKEQGAQVAGTAKEQGADVAATAADEAKQVAGEAKAKATDLLADVRTQVDEQSRTQLQGLASKLGELGDELDGLIRGDGATDGAVTDLARQLSERTRSLSNHLADREPSDLVGDVRSFARQRPGTFLLGAAAAGLIAGRLTRGAKKANSDDIGSGSSTSSTPSAPSAPSTSTTPSPIVPPPAGAGTYASDVAATSFADVPGGQNSGGRQ